MAHNIPRKALSPTPFPNPTPNTAGSPSPEPGAVSDGSASGSAAAGGIKRKPVDVKASNRVSGIGASASSTPQSAGFSVRTEEPAELRFALGPGGLHAWYDPLCKGKAGVMTVP